MLQDAAGQAPAPEALLPAETPCQMPDQVLRPPRRGRHQEGDGRARHVRLARVLLLTIWAAGVAAFAWTLYRVMSVETPTELQLVFLALSTLCFAWVALGSATAVVGFVFLMSRRPADSLELPTDAAPSAARAALLFPVYQEDPAAVAATVETMARELAAAGAAKSFDVFILSDTQDPARRQAEQGVYAELRRQCQAGGLQVYVRWRTPNAGKKAGNIRDWIVRFGAAYPYFVILDADSIMSAKDLLRLVAAMESNPRAGLIQSVPRLVGGSSMLARLQQFAAGYYGRIIAAGLAAWHGAGGNYWGHNAIIRTAAFAGAAGLPPLSGAPPLGGPILSHDFVEAALMRRAGWEVHLVPSVEGSYEGCPPTMSDLIVRDRRWAQGNLQHVRLLNTQGLPFLSRLHLAMGAVAYLSSATWALTLLVGVVLAIQASYTLPTYFGAEDTLFPNWPVFDAQTALVLFIATVLVVHLPKILGGIWALSTAQRRIDNGGSMRIIGGILLESVLSTLLAPVLMLTQSGAVISILLLRRDAGWGAQRRVSGTASLMDFMVQHRWHIAWGAAGAAVTWMISPAVFAWMSPITMGLLLAPLLSLLVAKEASGAVARLLSTPEDLHIPAVLSDRQQRQREWHTPGDFRIPRAAE